MSSRLSIFSSFVVGIALIFTPWMTLFGYSLWESNWLLQVWPGLRGPVLSAFARGAVTGLGLVNVLLALHDAHARLVGPDPGPGGADGDRATRGPGA